MGVMTKLLSMDWSAWERTSMDVISASELNAKAFAPTARRKKPVTWILT